MINMRKIAYLIILIATFQLAYPHKSYGFWYELKSPYPLQTKKLNQLENKTKKCDVAPSIPKHMNFTSIYGDGDASRSTVNQSLEKRYQKQIQNIRVFERFVHKNLERTLSNKEKTRQSIHCSFKWLENWADQNAMLKIQVSAQGQAVRKWTLASLASAYIQMQKINWIETSRKTNIEKWLGDLAYQVVADYNDDAEKASRNNNHQYWSAWAVMITGIVTNDRKLYWWAIKNYKKAIRQIDKDGTLPLELIRQSKAFHYHIFAVAPLIMIAETAKANGYNLFKYKNSRILKLINLILNELDHDQEYLTHKTGKTQDLTRTITSGQLAWLIIYDKNYDDTRAQKWIETLAPLKQRRIGGNLSLLYSDE